MASDIQSVRFQDTGATRRVDKRTMNPQGAWVRSSPISDTLDEIMDDQNFYEYMVGSGGAVLERTADGLRIAPQSGTLGIAGGGVNPLRVGMENVPSQSITAQDTLLFQTPQGVLRKTSRADLVSASVAEVDLAVQLTTTSVIVLSSAGADATIPEATPSLAGAMSAADKVIVNSISQANQMSLLGNTGPTTAPAVPLQRADLPVQVAATGTTIVGFLADGTLCSFDYIAMSVHLGVQTTGTQILITNSVGSGAILPAASATMAGVMTSADRAVISAVSPCPANTITGNATGSAALPAHLGKSQFAPATFGSGCTLVGFNNTGQLVSFAQVSATVNLSTIVGSTTLTVNNSAGTSATLPAATPSTPGVMTAVQASQLQSLVDNPVNLSFTRDATTLTVENSGGDDVILPVATTTDAGLMSAADKTAFDSLLASSTDLSVTRDATTVTIVNSTGDDAVIPAATTSLAGLMSAADKTTLASLSSASANLSAVVGSSQITVLNTAGSGFVIPSVGDTICGVLRSFSTLASNAQPTPPPPGHYVLGFTRTGVGANIATAYPFDDPVAAPSHGRTSADIGKPVVHAVSGAWPILDDANTNHYPTGILKGVSGTGVLYFARGGDVLTLPVALIENGSSYSIASNGRFVFWDLSVGKYVAAKPFDSSSFLPDLLEVLSVGGSTFSARVRDFGPMGTVIAGSGGGGSAEEEIELAAVPPSGTPAAERKLAIDTAQEELYVVVGGAWQLLPVSRGFGIGDEGTVSGAKTIDFTLGFLNRIVTLGGNTTLTLTPPLKPCWVTFRFTQTTGGHAVTWPVAITDRDCIVIDKSPSASTVVKLFWCGVGWHVEHSRKTGMTGLGVVGTSLALNFDQSRTDQQSLVLSGNTTITSITCTRGTSLRLLIAQDSTGGRTVSYPASCKGTPPTLATGSNAVTLVKLFSDGFGSFYFE
jgi:hypothetical protein